MTPFLKWAGGKRWLVSQQSYCVRLDAKRFLEPFLGSGAVYFHIEPKCAILSDLNSELISTYKALRDDPLKVKHYLLAHQRMHNHEHYYRVREQNPRSAATRAARFIYLNRTCFNGLYRVNLNGVFNVPRGTKNKVYLPTEDFEKISRLLHTAELVSCDFADTIDQAQEGDFLYIDPPYTVQHNNNNFLKYNEKIFSWADQKRLASFVTQAARRGASVLISNADHPCIHDLYAANYWQRLTVNRFSRLASYAIHRRGTTEVLISNYLKDNGEQEDPRY